MAFRLRPGRECHGSVVQNPRVSHDDRREPAHLLGFFEHGGLLAHVLHRRAAMKNRLRLAIGAGLGLLGLAWLVGLVLFVRAGTHTPITVTFPARQAHPAEEHDLVAYSYGPWIRASSYWRNPFNHHHPAYLVDRRTSPDRLEKWATDPKTDSAPWVELGWQGEHEVRRVRIQHAGLVEREGLTSRSYTLTCLASGPRARVAVTGNTSAIATHELHCPSARGIRLDISPGREDDMVRVYEVEVWGQ